MSTLKVSWPIMEQSTESLVQKVEKPKVAFVDPNGENLTPNPSTEDGYSDTATNIVNNAINDAIKQLESHFIEQFGFVPDESRADIVLDEQRDDFRGTPILLNKSEPSPAIPNIEWMSIDKFGRDLAEAKINEFIKMTWKFDESWLYCVDYLGEEEQKYDMRYKFRVRWSIPTRRKPIPRATASVYFTFSVSKIKPGSYPVDVYYVFETNQLVHRPGRSIFREKWLKDIIESKVRMYEMIDF